MIQRAIRVFMSARRRGASGVHREKERGPFGPLFTLSGVPESLDQKS